VDPAATSDLNAAGLIPCPFCGSPRPAPVFNAEGGWHAAMCQERDCLAIGPQREFEVEAKDAWNCRASLG
jgi:hypothetical protein